MHLDGFELDQDNLEFLYAVELVEKTNSNLYLTGKAGTGKTTFLKYIRKILKKNSVVVAPTGVAAVNAEGTTIHSFFKVPFGPFTPDDYRLRTRPNQFDGDKSTIFDHFSFSREKRELIDSLELLIIDEISMVRCDLLDVIDRLLRVYRKMPLSPFGGIQVLFIGDAFQLAPIAKYDEWEILSQFYRSPHFFSAKVMEAYPPVYIELQKIYRQNDPDFIGLLNNVRVDKVSNQDLVKLNQRYNPRFDPAFEENYITLATHNRQVDKINKIKLAALESESFFYEAVITGTFPNHMKPTDDVLQLKKDSQVMFVKNNYTRNYYNGKIGRISECDEKNIFVVFEDDEEILVEVETWKNIQYSWNAKEKKIEEKELGSYTQFPLKLAWAVTVHKSQGLTFEKVIADVGASFTTGQVYVALSRCTSLQGLVLRSLLSRRAIRTDPVVLKFAEQLTPEAMILQQLEEGRIDQLYLKSKSLFLNHDFTDSIEHLLHALSLRNDSHKPEFRRFLLIHIKILIHKNKFSALEQSFEKVLANKIFPSSQLSLLTQLWTSVTEELAWKK